MDGEALRAAESRRRRIGVTRSFNDNGPVVRLAKFTDKSQAIVVMEVP